MLMTSGSYVKQTYFPDSSATRAVRARVRWGMTQGAERMAWWRKLAEEQE